MHVDRSMNASHCWTLAIVVVVVVVVVVVFVVVVDCVTSLLLTAYINRATRLSLSAAPTTLLL